MKDMFNPTQDELTKKYKEDVEKALRAVAKGHAYHWETIANILADEVVRLRNRSEAVPPKESDIVKWFCNGCLCYHESKVYCPNGRY